MRFRLVVDVEVERESGKFAGRDEIAAELLQSLEDADPGEVSGVGADGDSEYSVVEWTASEEPK